MAATATVEQEVMDLEDDEEEEEEEGEEEEDLGPDFSTLLTLTSNNDELQESRPFKFLSVGVAERAVVAKRTPQLNRPLLRAIPSPLNNPHGSVDLSQGSTRVVVGVFGPSEVRMAKELPHRAAVDVIFRHKASSASAPSHSGGLSESSMSERSLEQRLTSLLETVVVLDDVASTTGGGVNVIVHEVHDDGGLFGVAVNALCLALLEGGGCCSLRSTFAAVTLAVDTNSGQIHFHPSNSPPPLQHRMCPRLEVVYGNDGRLLHVNSVGGRGGQLLPPRVLSSAVAAAWDAAKEIFEFYKQFINDVHAT